MFDLFTVARSGFIEIGKINIFQAIEIFLECFLLRKHRYEDSDDDVMSFYREEFQINE